MKEKPCVITTFNSIGNNSNHCQLLEMHKNMKFTMKCTERLAFRLILMQWTNYHDILWHIIKYNSLWTQEIPGNHMQCNKTNVEIQILYLECQWKPHIGIILCNAGLMKYMDFGIKCIWMPKGCAPIASTESTECPESRNQGGMIGHPIRKIWSEH